jgi:hypothetical protein
MKKTKKKWKSVISVLSHECYGGWMDGIIYPKKKLPSLGYVTHERAHYSHLIGGFCFFRRFAEENVRRSCFAFNLNCLAAIVCLFSSSKLIKAQKLKS